jgi:hypothetical protein
MMASVVYQSTFGLVSICGKRDNPQRRVAVITPYQNMRLFLLLIRVDAMLVAGHLCLKLYSSAEIGTLLNITTNKITTPLLIVARVWEFGFGSCSEM